jgi:hypothetical protein
MPQSMIGFLVGLAVLLVIALVPGRHYRQGDSREPLVGRSDAEGSTDAKR